MSEAVASPPGRQSWRSDMDYMRMAIEVAQAAALQGEVPVGAVLVKEGAVIASGGNCPIATHDPSAHAEMVALRAAGRALQNYRLEDTVLYVTLEPCLMCAAAIVHARVRRVVFGAFDPKAGAAGGIIDAFSLKGLNHRVDVFGGVLEQDCAQLLSSFFGTTRNHS
jgi:tRNA(adenine34) deaminase